MKRFCDSFDHHISKEDEIILLHEALERTIKRENARLNPQPASENKAKRPIAKAMRRGGK